MLPYTDQILADAPYVYYALEEASGTSMADTSGNSRTGTYVTPITYRQAGALTRVPGYSIALGGGGARLMSGGTAVNNPTTYSLELWFKTTTTLGGKLIGFESTQASTSSKFDRHIFMRNDGRLTYGGWTGGSLKLLTTAASASSGRHGETDRRVVKSADKHLRRWRQCGEWNDHASVVLYRVVESRLRRIGVGFELSVERKLCGQRGQCRGVHHRADRQSHRQPLRLPLTETRMNGRAAVSRRADARAIARLR
jgi:hypothetical protein